MVLAAGCCGAPPVWAESDDEKSERDPRGLLVLLRADRIDELERKVGAFESAYIQDSATLGDYDDAMQAFWRKDEKLEPKFTAWIERYPDSYGARLARAIHYISRAWSARGGKYISETPRKDIEATDAWFDKALADLKRSRLLSPKPLLSYSYEMNIGEARGTHQANRELLRQASAVHPGALPVYRAYMLSLRPQWGGSIVEMQAFLAEARRVPLAEQDLRYLEAKIWRARARKHKLANDRQAAIGDYTRAIELYEEVGTYENRGHLYAEFDQHDKALRDFTRILEMDPSSNWALSRRGSSRKSLGDIDGALADFNLLLERDARNTYGYAGRAHCYIKRQDYARAVADLRKAVEGENAWAIRTLGDLYWDGKGVALDKREGLRLWEQAAALGDTGAKQRVGMHAHEVGH